MGDTTQKSPYVVEERIPLCKRTFDVVFSLLGLIFGAPIIGLISLAVRLDTPGSILFTQERLGAGGRVFKLLKFRKFSSDWGARGPGVTVAGDVRMTRVGRVLERTKLDELPQLWNILKGEMSFVGPRPESLKYSSLFSGRYADVLKYRPGIFGPNQIDYRNESEMYPADESPDEFYRRVLFPAKAEQDLSYFSRASCWSDLGWIIKGILVSLVGTVNWKRVYKQQLPVVVIDVLAISIGWGLAVAMRYGFWEALTQQRDIVFTGAWLFPLVVIPIMAAFGSYTHTLRHIVLGDVVDQVIVAAVSWGVAFVVLLYAGDRNISLMLFPLSFLVASTFMIAPRIFYKEYLRRRDVGGHEQAGHIKLLIYGTDDRAINLGSLLQRGFPDACLLGFVDDTGDIRGRSILDLKILGSERDLQTIKDVHDFSQLWFSRVPEPMKLKRIRRWAKENGVELVILPALTPFASLIVGDEGAPGHEGGIQPQACRDQRRVSSEGNSVQVH